MQPGDDCTLHQNLGTPNLYMHAHKNIMKEKVSTDGTKILGDVGRKKRDYVIMLCHHSQDESALK